MYKKICFVCLFIILGCERNSPSPVELKIDDDYEYIPIGNFSTGDVKQRIHKVVNNQTLFDIAYMYNIDPINLARINGIKKPYKVTNGQILKIPNENGEGYSSTMAIKLQKLQSDEYSESKVPLASNITEQPGKEPQSEIKEEDIDEKFAKAISATATTEKNIAKNNAEVSAPTVAVTALTNTANVSSNEKIEDIVAPEKTVTKTVKNAKFIMPVEGGKIICRFGEMKDGFKNDGINIKVPKGTPVKASSGGSVIYIGYGSDGGYEDYGNVVIIQHDDEFVTSYSHLDTISVAQDAIVRQGQVIGTAGNTGNAKESQLYFEILRNSVYVDPYKYLQQK